MMHRNHNKRVCGLVFKQNKKIGYNGLIQFIAMIGQALTIRTSYILPAKMDTRISFGTNNGQKW